MSVSGQGKVIALAQQLEQDAVIVLYQLDLTELGGPVLCFHNEAVPAPGVISFGGVEFTAVPIEAKGFTFTSDGPPEPSINVGNIGGAITALARDYDDLRGAKLTRIRTFRRHLDDGADPDVAARWADDLYFVDRKVSENRLFAEFALGSSLDIEGVQLPARRILVRCRWKFKDGSNCPYVGADTTCGKTLADCVEKFGDDSALPYGGFAGVSRVLLEL